jgi:signal transduction histidine kinase
MRSCAKTPRREATGLTADDLPELLHTLEEGVLVVQDGAVRWVNPALSRMLARGVDALEGRQVSDLVADEEGRPLAELSAGDSAWLRDGRGQLVPVSIRQVRQGLYVVIDRTRESRLEHEVWRLGEQLQGAASVSGSGTILQDEIAGMIEHEIRTASTVIRGYLRLLLDQRAGELNDRQCDFLREASRETDRISALVDDLLDVAAAEGSRGLRVSRKPGRLRGVIDGALARVRPLVEQRGISISLEDGLEDDALQLDADRVERVLVNLLENAAKFSPPGSSIRLVADLVEQGDCELMTIAVVDEGPGVSNLDAQCIFEPFVRGSGEVPAAKGVGLGLAFCRRVIEAHGGSIEAVSGLGYGLFKLTLPVRS